MNAQPINQSGLILAAEDCDDATFAAIHKFSANDERVIGKLTAHGPVLLQGGRGSGKSALMIAASHRLSPSNPYSNAFGVYLSLRHLPLLRSEGKAYEEIFCSLLIRRIRQLLEDAGVDFDAAPDVASVQYAIAKLSAALQKRIVLLFDDAAHIGREASLADFFDLFRTLSSSTVSCKATIYPGVTQFGTRFDVYNDATVVDVLRNEEQPGFQDLFAEILRARYPELAARFSGTLRLERAAAFLGQSVVGNMRGFIFACNDLSESTKDTGAGVAALSETLHRLATNYYWPLLEEVRPKLGKYVPMVEPAQQIAEALFQECGQKHGGRRSALVHRDLIGRLSKPFEILEYAGFVCRREASRALKSGGRGARYSLNLSALLECVPGARLTSELFDRWSAEKEEPVEFHVRGSQLASIVTPSLAEGADLEIFQKSVSCLAKSRVYPYGLTDRIIETLVQANIKTVGDLARTTDEELDKLDWVGEATIDRIRNVVGQAVWM